MKYFAVMGSVAVVCVPDFIKIDSGFQKLIEEVSRPDRQFHSSLSQARSIQSITPYPLS